MMLNTLKDQKEGTSPKTVFDEEEKPLLCDVN